MRFGISINVWFGITILCKLKKWKSKVNQLWKYASFTPKTWDIAYCGWIWNLFQPLYRSCFYVRNELKALLWGELMYWSQMLCTCEPLFHVANVFKGNPVHPHYLKKLMNIVVNYPVMLSRHVPRQICFVLLGGKRNTNLQSPAVCGCHRLCVLSKT